MRPLRPKVDRYYDDVDVPEGNLILEEGIPKELRGRVDPEDWPGHFEISIHSYTKMLNPLDGITLWSVQLLGGYGQEDNLKITGLATRDAALEAGKMLVMAYLQGCYEYGKD